MKAWRTASRAKRRIGATAVGVPALVICVAWAVRAAFFSDSKSITEAAAVATIIMLPVTLLGVYAAILERTSQPEDLGQEHINELCKNILVETTAAERDQLSKLLFHDSGRSANLEYSRRAVQYLDDDGDYAGDLATIDQYYKNLSRGRLIVLGSPGSGKTILSITLLLRLASTRREVDPVPVRFSIAGWEPRRVIGELTLELAKRFRISEVEAQVLIRDRKVLPILDGLDEMDNLPQVPFKAEELIAQLNIDPLLTLPIVLTCREDTYDSLGRYRDRPGLRAVADATHIHIQDLSADRICEFISSKFRTQDDASMWETVLSELIAKPTGILAQSLSNPWWLTLALYAYGLNIYGDARPERPARMLEYDSVVELHEQLIASFIPAIVSASNRAKLKERPYRTVEVTRWLTNLSRHLSWQGANYGDRVDFKPHHLWPLVGVRKVYFFNVVVNLLICCACGVPGFIEAMASMERSQAGQKTAATVGLLVMWSLIAYLSISRGKEKWAGRRYSSSSGDDEPPLSFPVAAGCALPVAIVASPIIVLGAVSFARLCRKLDWITAASYAVGAWCVGFVLGLYLWLGLIDKLERFALFNSFRQAMWADIVAGIGYAAGVIGLWAFCLWSLAGGLRMGAIVALSVFVAVTLTRLNNLWRYLLTCSMGFCSGVLPLRIRSFLNWAYGAGLLRRSGDSFRFRHLELQGWLWKGNGGT